MTSSKTISMKAAAIQILEQAGGPMRSDHITRKALDAKLIKTSGKTPEATMAAQLSTDTKRKDSRFVRTGPGCYGLRGRDRKGQKPKAA